MDERNAKIVTSLHIDLNDDEDTYSIEIETDSHTIVYPKTNIVFGVSENIVFPLNVNVLNKHNDIVMKYGLNLANTNTDEATKTME